MSDQGKLSGNKMSDWKYFTELNAVDTKGRKLPYAVAMVCKCVAVARRHMRPIKTIWLCPVRFNEFESWTRRQAVEREADVEWEGMTLDGVFIELMPKFHITRARNGNDEIDWDFYEQPKAIEA